MVLSFRVPDFEGRWESNYVTSEHVYKRETLTDIKNKLMVTKGVRG